jgi:hypothetical protein
MEWMEWIAVGWSLTFVIPFVIWNCLLLYCVNDESPGYALVLTIAFVILIQACSDWSFVSLTSFNIGTLIKWGLSYIAIGVVYSSIKFILYLTDRKRKFDKLFNKYCERNKIKATIENLSTDHKYGCYTYIKDKSGYQGYLPTISESTKYVTFWMGYWPWSAAWTILNNPLKWLFEEIKSMLGGMYKNLHRKIVGTRQDAMDDWSKTPADGNKKDIDKPNWQ